VHQRLKPEAIGEFQLQAKSACSTLPNRRNHSSPPVFIQGEGNQEHEALRIKDMKQYLVVKIAKQLGALALEVIPVAGLFPLEAAEQFVRNAVASEPESLFLIQQVGNA
jgi:hypothetical protein